MSKNILLVKLIKSLITFILVSQSSFIFAQSAASHQKSYVVFSKNEYEKHLLWGERFYYLHINSLALKHFKEANTIRPGACFPQYRIQQINQRLNRSLIVHLGDLIVDFNKPAVLIFALVIIIVLSIISMVTALLAVLFNRNRMNKQEKKIQTLKEEFQLLLIDYLMSKNEPVEHFRDRIKQTASVTDHRKVLADQIIDLAKTLVGEEKLRLRELYLHLELHHDSFRKAMSRKWHIKAKGFRELAFMNIPDANNEIKRCLSCRNPVLRMEAQFALIRLDPENEYGFLNRLEKKFTLWEQLNIYETIIFHNLKLPDFENLLYSENSSVICFALRMIHVFKLKKTFTSMVALLTHKDPEVRKLTIQVMGNLKIRDSLPYLKKIYKQETYDNCLTIIQAMAMINDESMLNFLKLVLDKEDDVQLQIEAAKAINRIAHKGPETLTKLLASDYKNYQIIVKHVLDKRIN